MNGAEHELAIYHDVFAAIAAIIGSISLAVSGIVIAKINATQRLTRQAITNTDPIGNGYAEESRRAWQAIQHQIERMEDRQETHMAEIRALEQRHVKTNAWMTRHLADHARHDIEHEHGQGEHP